MTVTVDLSEKHPNMFMEELVVVLHAIQLLFCGGRCCQGQQCFISSGLFSKAYHVCLCAPGSPGALQNSS